MTAGIRATLRVSKGVCLDASEGEKRATQFLPCNVCGDQGGGWDSVSKQDGILEDARPSISIQYQMPGSNFGFGQQLLQSRVGLVRIKFESMIKQSSQGEGVMFVVLRTSNVFCICGARTETDA